jgi:copper chaperone CopZ
VLHLRNTKKGDLMMKNKIVLLLIVLLSISGFTLLQSQSKETIKEKLNDLKGSIEKIVISTDDGEVVLEGDEAKEVYKKLKNLYGEHSWTFEISDDAENGKEKVFVIKSGDDKDINWVTMEGKSLTKEIILDELDGDSKTIEVEINDDNKKVTITTIVDGQETTKVYEGDEADEYIKELEENDNIKILQIDKLGGEKERVKVIIEKLKKDDE